jgi:DNA-binding CsgD family transcriptional regulator
MLVEHLVLGGGCRDRQHVVSFVYRILMQSCGWLGGEIEATGPRPAARPSASRGVITSRRYRPLGAVPCPLERGDEPSHRRLATLVSHRMMDSGSSSPSLTPREQQLLHFLGDGADNATIAAAMGLSPRMFETEIQRIVDKLDVRTRVGALSRYLGSGQDPGLREELWQLSPRSREALLRWILADEGHREDIAAQALKRREDVDALADHITTLTTHPEQRQRFLRLLREIDPESG